MNPPPGVDLDEVQALSAFIGRTIEGRPCVVSCWKPTAEEWEEMRRTGRVWLVIYGRSMQPACVMGTSPFMSTNQEIDSE